MRDKRIVITTAALLCAVAWGVGELTREPWPFPIFPSFGTITFGDELDREERRIFVFHSAQETASLELGEVFDEPVGSFYRPMTDSFIAIEGAGSITLGRWADARASDELAWSQCVQALELVSVAGQNGERALLKRVEFPQCR